MNLQTEVRKGLKYLTRQDPVMARLIPLAGEIVIRPAEDLFDCLVVNIISQLISTKASDTVEARLRHYTENQVRPEVLLRLTQEEFRSFGIGKQKYHYLIALAEEFQQNPHKFHGLRIAEDEEVIRTLTSLKGIGKWTAQMLLISGLGRLDVFAPDDLGLRNAMILHYDMPADAKRAEFSRRAEAWAPYRSLASIALWRSLHV